MQDIFTLTITDSVEHQAEIITDFLPGKFPVEENQKFLWGDATSFSWQFIYNSKQRISSISY